MGHGVRESDGPDYDRDPTQARGTPPTTLRLTAVPPLVDDQTLVGPATRLCFCTTGYISARVCAFGPAAPIDFDLARAPHGALA